MGANNGESGPEKPAETSAPTSEAPAATKDGAVAEPTAASKVTTTEKTAAAEPSATPPAPAMPKPFPQPARKSTKELPVYLRPVVLFGFAAILMGCAAVLWVILHFATGGAPASPGSTATDAAGRAAAERDSAGARRDKEALAGPWGVPWGVQASELPEHETAMDPAALPSRGADKPLLALVEFGDYECEFTQKAERTVAKMLARFDDDVRLVYVHDPLAIHDHARLAAQAAEAARMQGRFGEMHERLLAAQGLVERNDVVRMARELGLDVGRFERDLDGAARDRVAGMVAFAKSHGLSGTPHFVIGGRIIEGARSEEVFVRVIEAALQDAKARIGSLYSREEVYRDSLSFLAGT